MLLTPQPASSRERPASNMGMQTKRRTLDLVLMIGLRYPFIAAWRLLLQPIEGKRMNASANPPHLQTITLAPSDLRHHTCVQALASAMARHYSEGGTNVRWQASA